MSQLVTSSGLLSTVLATSPVGAAVASLDLRLVQCNDVLVDLLGFSQRDLIGTSLAEICHPDDILLSPSEVLGRIQTGPATFSQVVRLQHHSGRYLRTRVTGSVLPANEGEPMALLLFVEPTLEVAAGDNAPRTSELEAGEVLERITDGFLSLNREWRITYINEAAARMLEQPREELLGSNLWEAFPQAIETPVHAAYFKALRDNVPVSIDNYYPPLRAWFDVRAFPSNDGLSVFFRDITEAKQLEHALRSSDAKHRFLLDHVPAVIYALAPGEHQTRLYFSPRHEELTGYSLAETMSNPGHWLERLHPDDRPRVALENDRAEAAGDLFRAEYRLRRKDGSYVWVLDECMPVRDERGEIVTWQGVLLDITDRVNAQQAQAHLAALVMSAEDAVISSDLEGAITSWNPAATRLYGYEAGEIIGQPFSRLLPSDIDQEALEANIQAARNGETVDQFETHRQRRDGTVIDVALTMSPIRDENGKIIGVSTITRDITQRNQVEKALRDALEAAETAARTKSLFLAMMSHELRTPIQAVLGYAELLLLDPDVELTEEQMTDVTCIRDGARHLDRLIRQLLDLSRLEAGRLELTIEPFSLLKVVEDVIEEIRSSAATKYLDLVVDVPESLPQALGDQDRVLQILLNLVENAIKFTEAGKVKITARAMAHGLQVEISDTGIGISPEALPTIFEEFRQVDANLSRRYGGAGLGLAIAQRLATQMNGSLRVSSAVDEGSTFVLALPAAP